MVRLILLNGESPDTWLKSNYKEQTVLDTDAGYRLRIRTVLQQLMALKATALYSVDLHRPVAV